MEAKWPHREVRWPLGSRVSKECQTLERTTERVVVFASNRYFANSGCAISRTTNVKAAKKIRKGCSTAENTQKIVGRTSSLWHYTRYASFSAVQPLATALVLVVY